MRESSILTGLCKAVIYAEVASVDNPAAEHELGAPLDRLREPVPWQSAPAVRSPESGPGRQPVGNIGGEPGTKSGGEPTDGVPNAPGLIESS